MKPLRGSCLCGEVAYECEPDILKLRYCFCPRCQKATGSGQVAHIFVHPDKFAWKRGKEKVVRYDLPEARSFSTAFCGKCGCPLPRLTRGGSAYIIPAGSLDGDPGVKPEEILFREHQAPWYVDPTDLPRETD
jgi:hypothetical protein